MGKSPGAPGGAAHGARHPNPPPDAEGVVYLLVVVRSLRIRFLLKFSSLVVSAHGPVEFGEVVEAGGKVWVLVAASRSPDVQGLPEERLGVGVLSLFLKE